MLEPLRQSLPSIDPSGASGSASCALPARYEAVKGARDFTRTTLRHWELPQHFDSVALVVSELVTNALRHGLAKDAPFPAEPPVLLHLMRWTSRLVCAVRDPSGNAPIARMPDFGEGSRDATAGDAMDDLNDIDVNCGAFSGESGRGLFLVESFSDSWGWQPLTGAGKVVWALFRLPVG